MIYFEQLLILRLWDYFMLNKRRQQLLLDYITSFKSAQVTNLSDQFNISVSTVRRDLIELEQRGLISRVHGGAVLSEKNNEPPIHQRSFHQADEKKRIGEAAAGLVEDGDTILISAGTTTEAMLPFLASKNNLTVITNSIRHAYHLTKYPQIAVIMLGGWLRHAEYSVHGPLTESTLKELQPLKVFFGIFGICPESGLSGSDLQEVQTDRFLISVAPQLIILADHTKFCRTGPVRLAPIETVSTVVTDVDTTEEDVSTLRAIGVEVILV
jgi:DeoR/GlpR family transcriptional regulator of sugar metabolism